MNTRDPQQQNTCEHLIQYLQVNVLRLYSNRGGQRLDALVARIEPSFYIYDCHTTEQ